LAGVVARMIDLSPAIALFLAVGIIWELSVRIFGLPGYLLPAPSVIAQKLWLTRAMLLENLAYTMAAAILGFIVGTIFAVALAVLFLYSRSAERALFPWAITLKASFPHINYTMISGDNQRITNELLAREADLVLAYDVSDHVRADRIHSFLDPVGIITVPDHPFSRMEKVTGADIADCALIAPGDDWLRHSGLKHIFEGEQAPGKIVAKAERPGMLKALVKAGLGIAILSRLGAEKEVSEGQLAWTPLDERVMEPPRVSMLVPRGRVQSIYIMEFIELIKQDLMDYTRANKAGGFAV
jgi:DNA-binding transcriptional LysR family regulator